MGANLEWSCNKEMDFSVMIPSIVDYYKELADPHRKDLHLPVPFYEKILETENAEHVRIAAFDMHLALIRAGFTEMNREEVSALRDLKGMLNLTEIRSLARVRIFAIHATVKNYIDSIVTNKPSDPCAGKHPYKITLLTADLHTRATQNYNACVAILMDCNLKFEVTIDRARLMKATNGKINPADGMVIYYEADDKVTRVLRDWHDLVMLIHELGLKPL